MEIRWFKTDLDGNKKDLYYYNSKVDFTNIFDKDDEPGFHSGSTLPTLDIVTPTSSVLERSL